jgi:hypothetical protein
MISTNYIPVRSCGHSVKGNNPPGRRKVRADRDDDNRCPDKPGHAAENKEKEGLGPAKKADTPGISPGRIYRIHSGELSQESGKGT